MGVNITAIKTSSDGIWEGENPLNYAFPLLIVQTTLVLLVSRFFAFLLKPLRQPKVVAEILGGVILGPSAFGKNQKYMQWIFPQWSTPILESVASIGLLFFLFFVGLELDLSSIKKGGKKALYIAAGGISLPFILGTGVAFLFRKVVAGADEVGYAQYVVFMGVALSITAFPVLARILAELKLLTTPVGETAMAAAAFNDIAAWILLALAIALAGNGGNGGSHKSPIVSIYVLLSGAAFVIFMMVIVKPGMKRIARRCSAEHDTIDETYICLILAGVLVAGFITDFIGIHAIFGAFIFGLTIPKEGNLAEKLMERIEDFVSGLLLPLYFASSGLKTDVTKINSVESWCLLALVITVASAGKIMGTFMMAIMSKIPARESLTLGFLMNTKGLVELIVLNIGKEKKVLNNEVFAILVLMALFTTFLTTPTVMAIYKPVGDVLAAGRRRIKYSPSKTSDDDEELRILACVHGPNDVVPSLIKLTELTRSANKSQLKLYVLNLVELTERSSSIIMFRRLRKNGFDFINQIWSVRSNLRNRAAVSFQAYGQLGRVRVRSASVVSPLITMHEDIHHLAADKRMSMIILPFHKRWTRIEGDDDENEIESVYPSWRVVNEKVLKEAPCSVAVLVDRGYGDVSQQKSTTMTQSVCVLIFGGSNDMEALKFSSWIVDHPSVKLTMIRFIEKEGMESNNISSTGLDPHEIQKEMNENAIREFLGRWNTKVEYKERASFNVVDGVLALGRSGDFDLIVVGNGWWPTNMVAEWAVRTPEHPELGLVGDLLASSGQGILSSVLVIQQPFIALHAQDTPMSNV